MSDITFDTTTRVDDLYERIRQLVLDDKIGLALALWSSIESYTERLGLLVKLAHALARALAHARALALASAHIGVIDFAHAHAQSLARALASAHAFARDSTLASTLVRIRVFDFARVLARVRDLAHVRALARAQSLAFALDHDLARIRDLDLQAMINISDQTQRFNRFIIAALEFEVSAANLISSLSFPEISQLTPQVLMRDVAPILDVVAQLQESLDRLNGRENPDIDILAIKRGSVKVDMTGVAQVVELILIQVLPKRRAIYLRQKELENEGKALENQLKAAALEDIILIERELKQEDLKQKQIETERKKLQLAGEKLALLVGVYEKGAPDLAPKQRIEEATRMLPVFNGFFDGPEDIQILK